MTMTAGRKLHLACPLKIGSWITSNKVRAGMGRSGKIRSEACDLICDDK